jgi:hypothetical protein
LVETGPPFENGHVSGSRLGAIYEGGTIEQVIVDAFISHPPFGLFAAPEGYVEVFRQLRTEDDDDDRNSGREEDEFDRGYA